MATDTSPRSYENSCRTCMKEDPLMFDVFIEKLEGTSLADMLVSCTKLNILKDDSLPRKICRYCYNCLISFSQFRNMAEKAEAKLMDSILNRDEFNHNNNEQGNFFEIKIETGEDNYVIFEPERVKQENYGILDEHKNSEHCVANVSNQQNCVVEKSEMIDKPKFKCNFCSKQFSKLSKLEHHRQKHPTNNCEACTLRKVQQNENMSPSMLNKEDSTNTNILDTNTSSELLCIICSCKFKSMNSLSVHMKDHLQKNSVISCDECGQLFQKISHLKYHKAAHHDNCSLHTNETKSTVMHNVNKNVEEISLLKDVKFQCNICLSSYKNINSLSAHMRKHTEKGRIISCRECKKVFKKLSHLKRHEVQHETNCPYKCSLCPKAFLTEELLKDHINKHKGVKPHGCPVCGKKFSHLSTLTTHVKIHTRDKAYLCPTCGKKFDSSTNLNQHMLRHTGLKEFACTMCPKRFVSKGELKSHNITHTGERSYTCDQCGASFTKRSSLTKHKLRHLGLKPYQCETCSIKFTCKDHLKRHYRIHTGEKPYKCNICDRAFTQSNDLVKHRRAHVGDKVYKCPQCTESFRLNIQLRQHISDHFVSSKLQALNVTNKGSMDIAISGCSTTNKIVPDNLDIRKDDLDM